MRVHDWPQRLDQAIETARTRTFAYGVHDCCLFAADCVNAMTGVDYAASYRGYDSQIAAYRIVAEYGSLTGLLTSLLGEPVEPAFAGRGDVVIAEVPTVEGQGESVGICLGPRCVFPANGLAFYSRDVIRLAWRIR